MKNNCNDASMLCCYASKIIISVIVVPVVSSRWAYQQLVNGILEIGGDGCSYGLIFSSNLFSFPNHSLTYSGTALVWTETIMEQSDWHPCTVIQGSFLAPRHVSFP